MRIILFFLFIVLHLVSKGQEMIKEGRYFYKSLKKSDLQNGTIIEIRNNNIVYLSTYFGFSGKITYKGEWEIRKGYLYICKLEDTNGIKPSRRSVDFDTSASRKNIQICIDDEAKFTSLYPAKITIDDKKHYYLKNDDTLSLEEERIRKVEIIVEDYSETLKVSFIKPVLIKLTVRNKLHGTLYYYFRDIKLKIKGGNLYYGNVALIKG